MRAIRYVWAEEHLHPGPSTEDLAKPAKDPGMTMERIKEPRMQHDSGTAGTRSGIGAAGLGVLAVRIGEAPPQELLELLAVLGQEPGPGAEVVAAVPVVVGAGRPGPSPLDRPLLLTGRRGAFAPGPGAEGPSGNTGAGAQPRIRRRGPGSPGRSGVRQVPGGRPGAGTGRADPRGGLAEEDLGDGSADEVRRQEQRPVGQDWELNKIN